MHPLGFLPGVYQGGVGGMYVGLSQEPGYAWVPSYAGNTVLPGYPWFPGKNRWLYDPYGIPTSPSPSTGYGGYGMYGMYGMYGGYGGITSGNIYGYGYGGPASFLGGLGGGYGGFLGSPGQWVNGLYISPYGNPYFGYGIGISSPFLLTSPFAVGY